MISSPRIARALLYSSGTLILILATVGFYLLYRNESIPTCNRSPEERQSTVEAAAFCVLERAAYDPYEALFEAFSLYSIAKSLRRTPVIKTYGGDDERRRERLFDAFPVLRELFDNGACLEKLERTSVSLYVPSTRMAANIDAIATSEDRHLQLSGICESKDLGLLENVRSELRQRLTALLDAEDDIGEDGGLTRKFIVPSTDVKICVHLQRSSLTADFSTSFVFDTVEKIARDEVGIGRSVSVLLFGDVRQEEYETLGFYSSGLKYLTLAVQRNSEEETWAVAGKYCSSMLLTAPSSSAGWWLAFLAPPQTRVFYANATTSLPLPSSWTPLPLSSTTSPSPSGRGRGSSRGSSSAVGVLASIANVFG